MMKRFLSTCLMALLISCLFTTAGVAAQAPDWDLKGTIFPLETPVTFQVLTCGHRYNDIRKINENEDWLSFMKATNVNIEFVYLGAYDAPETRESLQLRLLSGDYCDAIMSWYVDTLTTADIADLKDAGIVVPLNEYALDGKTMPNFYNTIATCKPTILSNMKDKDGDITYVAGVNELAGYTAGEAGMLVNSAWLAAWKTARGLDRAPETLAEFEDMLVYFRDNDLNSNGIKDEIPYFIAQSSFNGCCTLEHAMGMYGVATKDSALDMNIMIGDDQKAFFAHTTDMYKAALKTFSKWYQEKLVWQDLFIANAETIAATLNATNVGVFNACENLVGYEPLMPPVIEGYHARYHMHPSLRGGLRQQFAVITDKCKQPDIMAAFLDALLYNFDNNIRAHYSTPYFEQGYITINDEGKYVIDATAPVTIEPGEAKVQMQVYTGMDFCFTLEEFNKKMDFDSYFGGQVRVETAILYREAGIWNPTECLWPRCALLEDDAEDYAFMYTDVKGVVAEYRAKFITGEYDVDTKWDEFQTKLNNLGIEKMRDIIQRAYDAYLNK